MKRSTLLAACVVLTACDDSGMFPIQPGGGGNGGSMDVDAAGIDGSSTVTGRVCLLADPRKLTTCASSGAGDLRVSLGLANAITGGDGAFSLAIPTSTDGVWDVSGGTVTIEPSAMRYALGTNIPAITELLYGDMVVAMQASISNGTGAIIAQLRTGTAVVSGATVTASPAPDSLVYYDGPSATEWALTSTGASGVVWISSIAPGNATLTVDTGAPTSVGNIPVVAGAITYVFAEIP